MTAIGGRLPGLGNDRSPKIPPFVECQLAAANGLCSEVRLAVEAFGMRSFVIALCVVPLAGCAANTPPVKMVEQCHMVPNEDPGSNIKMKKECTSVPEGDEGAATPPQ